MFKQKAIYAMERRSCNASIQALKKSWRVAKHRGYTRHTTVIVDNDAQKAIANPANLIEVTTYHGFEDHNDEKDMDCELLRVLDTLQKVSQRFEKTGSVIEKWFYPLET